MTDCSLLVLSAGPLRASVCPGLGAGLADLSLRGPTGFFYPLMRRAAPGETNASLLASFFMAPWVNRVRGGTFAFSGRTITLRTNTADGMAQHGDVRRRAWRTLSADATTARLEFNSADVPDSNWPWRYRVTAEYALTPEALTIDLSVFNDDREAFPAGCGHHPYFSRRLWSDRDELRIRVPVAGRYPLEQGCAIGAAADDDLSAALRTGSSMPDRPIDGCFTAMPSASDAQRAAELRWPASGVLLRIFPSLRFNHWVVFCPHAEKALLEMSAASPLSFVAVEPQSQANDALNLCATMSRAPGAPGDTTGTVLLRPGEALRTGVRFEVTIGA